MTYHLNQTNEIDSGSFILMNLFQISDSYQSYTFFKLDAILLLYLCSKGMYLLYLSCCMTLNGLEKATLFYCKNHCLQYNPDGQAIRDSVAL